MKPSLARPGYVPPHDPIALAAEVDRLRDLVLAEHTISVMLRECIEAFAA